MNDVYDEVRPLLFSIAYRMLGSASDAEDIVQEAFLRFHRASVQGQTIGSPRSFLSTVTTRLCIDHLRSARVRRERYVGPWLPEPVITDDGLEEEPWVRTAESLSMAFLVLLESLSPVERAVFLLREVFDYRYDQIAEIVNKSEENCRQIAVRARRQVEQKRPRFEVSARRRDELARRFFEAVTNEDATALVTCWQPTWSSPRTAAARRRRCSRVRSTGAIRCCGPCSPRRQRVARTCGSEASACDRTTCASPPSTDNPAPSSSARMGIPWWS